MTLAVFHRLDHGPVHAHGLQNPLGEFLVVQFQSAADVVGLAGSAGGAHDGDAAAVVINVQPVATRPSPYSGTLAPSMRLVTNSGMTFSGNW